MNQILKADSNKKAGTNQHKIISNQISATYNLKQIKNNFLPLKKTPINFDSKFVSSGLKSKQNILGAKGIDLPSPKLCNPQNPGDQIRNSPERLGTINQQNNIKISEPAPSEQKKKIPSGPRKPLIIAGEKIKIYKKDQFKTAPPYISIKDQVLGTKLKQFSAQENLKKKKPCLNYQQKTVHKVKTNDLPQKSKLHKNARVQTKYAEESKEESKVTSYDEMLDSDLLPHEIDALLQIGLNFLRDENIDAESNIYLNIDPDQMTYEQLIALGDAIGYECKGYKDTEIDAIPQITLQEELNENCEICKDELTQDQVVLQLHCSHLYHKECITKWLTNNKTCPCCRVEALQ